MSEPRCIWRVGSSKEHLELWQDGDGYVVVIAESDLVTLDGARRHVELVIRLEHCLSAAELMSLASTLEREALLPREGKGPAP